MTGQLNTTVNGSSGTCVEAADWLMLYTSRADIAAEQCQKAINTAQSSWQGPASSAFQSSVRAPGWQCDDLSYTCQRYERALREFAAALDNVIERMLNARDKAANGGLEIEGPFILPPKPIGPGPSVPQGTFTLAEADSAYQTYRNDMLAHAANVDEYNRKVRVFNECSTLVTEARAREDEAHSALQDVLATDGSGLDVWKIGHTTAAKVVSYIGAAENSRAEALVRADMFAKDSRTYQQMAMGTLDRLSARDRMLLFQAMAKAGVGEADYRQRATQFERYIKHVPAKMRGWFSAYPGKEGLDFKNVTPESSPGAQAAKQVLKKLPYVGSALVAANEARGALKGEQTWTEATVRTGGILAGASVVGYYGATAGSLFGPPGTIIGGLVGGTVGGIAGEHVVDIFLPSDDPHGQPKAQERESSEPMSDSEFDREIDISWEKEFPR